MKSIVILILCIAVVVQTHDTKYEKVSQPFAVQSRIHQGQTAVKGQFPHMAFLSVGCGGSLIDAKWVLTAAHCAINSGALKVYLGDINRELSPVIVPVSKYYIHPERNNSWERTDIALLELDEPVTFTDNIKAIRLPNNTNDLYVGEEVTLIGKGRVDNETFADDLQYVNLNVLPFQNCRQYRRFTPFEMCTGGVKGAHQGGCSGDSGNGLIMRRPDGDTLIGILSLSVGYSCETLLTNSYMRVNYFLDWIREITKLNI